MESNLRVRPYEPSDAERCCSIINEAIVAMDGLNEAARVRIRANNTPDGLGADLEAWTALVVESNEGLVVGLGALDHNEVKRVYVDPAAQNQGAARSLMSALEAIARTRQLGQLRLEASPSSVEFYESVGFVAGQPDSLRVEDASFHFVHMKKALRRKPPS